MTNTKNFYTPEQVAKEVYSGSICANTIRKMCHNGEIPYESIGFGARRLILIPAGWVRFKIDKANTRDFNV